MTGKEYNEAVGWKNKLEDPACLSPGAPLNKEAAWDKLYAGLDEKPARKRFGWYWLAAACLLALALYLPWATGPEKTKGHLSPALRQQPYAAATGLPIPLSPVKKEQPVKKDIPEPGSTTTAVLYPQENTRPALPPAVTPPETPVIAAAMAAPDTLSIAAIPVAPKQKLRVIALGELEPPVEEQGKPGKSSGRPYFRMKLLNNTYADVSTKAEHTAPDIIKIKLSPQN